MLNNNPALVSVLIPVYNMASMLPEAINSITGCNGLGSKFYVECIIIDDGSEEHTRGVINKKMNKAIFSIKQMHIDHGGKSAAINAGLQMATGTFITILDADDKLPPDSLISRLQMAQNTGCDIVLGGFETFDDSGTIYHRRAPDSTVREVLIDEILTNIKSPLHLNSMLIKSSLVKKVGDFDEYLLRGQDKDYAIRLLKNTDQIKVINQPVYSYRRYSRGFKKQLANRLLTMKCKHRIMNKHTVGVKRMIYQLWSWGIEVLKLGYELVFGVYKK